MRFITPEKRRPVDLSEPPRTLQVFAAGLGRSGTSSLHHVFENTLDLYPALHTAYVTPSAERLQLYLAASNEDDKEKRQAILHKLFDGYVASCDEPGSTFVDDVMEMYPSAKLILNKRSRAEDWVRSMKTIQFCSTKWFYYVRYWRKTAKPMYLAFKAKDERLMRVLGLDSATPSVDMYEGHQNWVRGLAKTRGVPLLEWMPEMGYAPLCEFLGKEIPEGPFPRMNDAKDMRMVKYYTVARGLVLWVVVLGLVAAPIVASYAWFKF